MVEINCSYFLNKANLEILELTLREVDLKTKSREFSLIISFDFLSLLGVKRKCFFHTSSPC